MSDSFLFERPEEKSNDLDKCPRCGGVADNGHDRCIPPTAYNCKKCMSERNHLNYICPSCKGACDIRCEKCEPPQKVLYVEMSDGVWAIPAQYIAANRAAYYCQKGEDGEEAYQEEYNFGLNNKNELIDWAEGNMNWEDVSSYAYKVADADTAIDREDEWVSGRKWIS